MFRRCYLRFAAGPSAVRRPQMTRASSMTSGFDLAALRGYWALREFELSLQPSVNWTQRLAKGFRRIPWSLIGMFTAFMLFFGLDVTAGVKHTAHHLKEAQEKRTKSPEVEMMEKRQWSMEQIKAFQEGKAPQPSYSEGAPREKHPVMG